MKKIDADLTKVDWVRSTPGDTDQPAVEIAYLPERHIGMRDSRNPNGPVLIFTPDEWSAFLAGVADGEFNRPSSP